MADISGGAGSGIPVGTTEEVIAAGLNPAKVASCAKFNMASEVRGCPMWGDCKFDRPRFGGFKGTEGPKNIGFEIITGDVLAGGEPVVQQGFCACHVWVRSLKGRAEFGHEQRRNNKPGEIITIVAQEGGEITMRTEMPINVEGKVIKQDRRMFAILEEQGIKVDKNERREAHDYTFVNVKLKVPAHPRPGERSHLTHAQQIIQNAQARLLKERELEDAIMTGGSSPRAEAEPLLAEPIRRGPGRPRKSEVEAAE